MEQTKAKTVGSFLEKARLYRLPEAFGTNMPTDKCDFKVAVSCMEDYANYRIANMEAQNKELTDNYAVLVQDYSDKFYEQAKQIKELREALEEVVKHFDDRAWFKQDLQLFHKIKNITDGKL